MFFYLDLNNVYNSKNLNLFFNQRFIEKIIFLFYKELDNLIYEERLAIKYNINLQSIDKKMLPSFIINKNKIFMLKPYGSLHVTKHSLQFSLLSILDSVIKNITTPIYMNTELQVSLLSSVNRKDLIEENIKKINQLKNKRLQSIDLVEKNIDAQIKKIEELNNLLNLKHEDYIKTKHWQDIRNNILLENNYTCQICNKKFSKELLNVHHLNYSNLGKETKEDLMLLCIDCHREQSSILNT